MYEVSDIETDTAFSVSVLPFINTGSDLSKVRKGLSLVGETEVVSPLTEVIVPELPLLTKITEYPATVAPPKLLLSIPTASSADDVFAFPALLFNKEK